MTREDEVLVDYSTPGLRRNELTPDGKRWQLWGKGIRGKEADEVIRKVYDEDRHG